MRSITIDGTNVVTIEGVEYYYGEVVVNDDDYIVVPDTNDYIMVYDESDWNIYNGRTYHSTEDNLTIRLSVRKDYANPDNITPFTYTIHYDFAPLRVAQLEDRDGYPLTPYSSAKGVTLRNGKDIEEQINHMLPEVISTEEMDALVSIEASGETAVEAVKEEGSEYRADIDFLAEHVDELDKEVFPLKIGYTLSTNYTTYENTIGVTIKEYDTGEPNLNEEYVEKWVNDSYAGKIYDPIEYMSSFTITEPIQGMKERFKIVAGTVNGKSDVNEFTRYLCFYGANKASEMTSDIALGLRKVLTTGVSFNPTISTERNDYIWLIVPEYLTINKVTSSGFDVTLEEYDNSKVQKVNIGTFGRYKCYRTLNALDKATWKLVIS